MELKRYVLTTDGYIYKKKQVKQHKDTNTTHIVSFGIVSYHLINIKKTSDNILDFVLVQVLVPQQIRAFSCWPWMALVTFFCGKM